MNGLTAFGAGAVTLMLVAYTLERRSTSWVLVFALACAASSLYGWLAGTWPFGVVEGVWACVALRRWLQLRRATVPASRQTIAKGERATAVRPSSREDTES